MRTTKMTVIELDDNDSMQVRFGELVFVVTAKPSISGEDGCAATLKIATDEVTFVQGEDVRLASEEGERSNGCLSDGADLTITLV